MSLSLCAGDHRHSRHFANLGATSKHGPFCRNDSDVDLVRAAEGVLRGGSSRRRPPRPPPLDLRPLARPPPRLLDVLPLPLPLPPESESLSSLSLSLSLPLSDAFFFLGSSLAFFTVPFFRFAFGGFLFGGDVDSRSELELSSSASSTRPFTSFGFRGFDVFRAPRWIDFAATGTTMFELESSGSDIRVIVIGKVIQVPPPPEQSPSPMGAVSCLCSQAFLPKCRTGADPSRGLGDAILAGVSLSATVVTGGVWGGAGGDDVVGGAMGGVEATGGTGVAGAGLADGVICGAGDAPAAFSGVSILPSADGTRTSQGGPGACGAGSDPNGVRPTLAAAAIKGSGAGLSSRLRLDSESAGSKGHRLLGERRSGSSLATPRSKG